MNFKINSKLSIINAVSISRVAIYAVNAVANVAVIRRLSALARLRVLDSGIFSAVMRFMDLPQPIARDVLRLGSIGCPRHDHLGECFCTIINRSIVGVQPQVWIHGRFVIAINSRKIR